MVSECQSGSSAGWPTAESFPRLHLVDQHHLVDNRVVRVQQCDHPIKDMADGNSVNCYLEPRGEDSSNIPDTGSPCNRDPKAWFVAVEGVMP